MRRIGSLMVQGSAICFDYQTAEESTVTKKNEELAAGAGEQMKAAYSLDECDESQTYYAGSGRRRIHPCCKGEIINEN